MKYKLIKEYPDSPKLETIAEKYSRNAISYTYAGKTTYISSSESNFFEKVVTNHPEFWEEIDEEEYQILSFKQNSGIEDLWIEFYHGKWCRNVDGKAVTMPYTTKEILDNNFYYINSVKRISDGEVFVIGDIFRDSTGIYSINKIYRDSMSDRIYFDVLDQYGSFYRGKSLAHVIKYNKALFITDDGVEIFKGDKYYQVYNYKILTGEDIKSSQVNNASKYFSTKEAAEEYILINKPCLSINDITKTIFQFCEEKILLELKELVKQQLENNK